MTMNQDCIIVGAGPSGLTAALFLARYRRRAITFHDDSPRNLYSHGVHGFLGHHGILPADLLARGREEVRAHGGLIVEARVMTARRIGDEEFQVTAVGRTGEPSETRARRLLLATGLKDLLPNCPGFLEFYGTSVFHCPDCDGYEVTGQRVALLCRDQKASAFALGMLTWTDRLTVLTDGPPLGMSAEDRATLDHLGIPIVEQPIAALDGDRERGRLERVRFTTGEALECDALFFHFGAVPASDLHEQLGCRLDPESGLVWTNEDQETSVPGVYAAGDLSPRSQLAVVAAAEGAMAAIHIHKSLAARKT